MRITELKFKDFAKRANVHRMTLYRFYKKFPLLSDEITIKGRCKYIPISHLEFFDKEYQVEHRQKVNEEIALLKIENIKMKKLIDVLTGPDTLEKHLHQLKWTLFGTVSYSDEYSKTLCFNKMTNLFNHLSNKYGNKMDLRFFFTTEGYGERDGNHSHFVLYISNEKYLEEVVKLINKRNKKHRVYLEKYDKYRNGIYYITKQGLQDVDWDILFSNESQFKREIPSTYRAA